MIQVDKSYRYDGDEYVVVGLLSMIAPNGEAVPAVSYRRKVAGDGGASGGEALMVRSQRWFEYLFVPTTLEIGDRVVAISGGSIVAGYEVVNIDEEANTATIKDVFSYTLTVSRDILKDGALTRVSDNTEAAPADTPKGDIEYYYQMTDARERIANVLVVRKMIDMLIQAAERIHSISPINTAHYNLEEAQRSLHQTLNIIYTKLGIFDYKTKDDERTNKSGTDLRD